MSETHKTSITKSYKVYENKGRKKTGGRTIRAIFHIHWKTFGSDDACSLEKNIHDCSGCISSHFRF